MDALQHEMLAAQISEMSYFPPQYDMAGTMYIPGPHNSLNTLDTSIKHEPFLDAFENDHHLGLDDRHSNITSPNSAFLHSTASPSSQSLSPDMYSQSRSRSHFPLSDLPTLQPANSMSSSSLDTTSLPNSRKNSTIDTEEGFRAERRRAQNRAAQRAYRQRKDQSLKQREDEIDTLRTELDKAQRINATLWKVVGVLRERIKNPEGVEEVLETAGTLAENAAAGESAEG